MAGAESRPSAPRETPISTELLPSVIVTQAQRLADDREAWAQTHRTATLAEHGQGVLALYRRAMGPTRRVTRA